MAERVTDSGTIGGTLLDHASERPGEPAVTTGDGTTTYAQLAENAKRAAAALRAAGVQRGDRVAILARNGLPYVELTFGASLAGAVLVGLNIRLSAPELADIIGDAAPVLVFVEDEWEHLLAQTPDVPTLVWLDREYKHWRSSGSDGFHVQRGDPDAVVLQMYTGGTTGRAKGVMLLERNVVANVRAVSQVWLMDAATRTLSVLPLFHVSGTGFGYSTLYAGGELVLPREATPPLILREIAERRISHSALVPSMIAQLLIDPACGTTDLSSLRVLVYGAAPSAGTTIGEAMQLLPNCAFFHGYGLTETCGGIACSPPHYFGDEDDGKHGSVGQAIPTYDLKIVDRDTLEDLPPGKDGEVWARGPQNTIGYWNRPDETASLLMPDGWLRTGDIGVMDEDGYLYLKDRLKDMIITGGENVYSVEVENALVAHPSVLEAAVYGVPDERWGEAVWATVSLKPGHEATEAELIAFSRERLAHYKCPKVVEVVDDLPKSGSGKILKRELRDQHLSGAR